MATDDKDEILTQEEAMAFLKHNDERQEILDLCEKYGYGRVMQVASTRWIEKDPHGAITMGPCRAFTVMCTCQRQGHCDKCYGCGWVFKEKTGG